MLATLSGWTFKSAEALGDTRGCRRGVVGVGVSAGFDMLQSQPLRSGFRLTISSHIISSLMLKSLV